MMPEVEEDASVVRVRVINEPQIEKPKQGRIIRTTFFNVTLGPGADPVLVLGRARNRLRAVFQITTGGPVNLANNKAAAKAGASDCFQFTSSAGGIFVLQTTEEVWATNTSGNATVTVASEYEEFIK